MLTFVTRESIGGHLIKEIFGTIGVNDTMKKGKSFERLY
jgi:hypothetical protein